MSISHLKLDRDKFNKYYFRVQFVVVIIMGVCYTPFLILSMYYLSRPDSSQIKDTKAFRFIISLKAPRLGRYQPSVLFCLCPCHNPEMSPHMFCLGHSYSMRSTFMAMCSRSIYSSHGHFFLLPHSPGAPCLRSSPLSLLPSPGCGHLY